MPKSTILAVSAVLSLGLSDVTLAYRGDFESASPARLIMMEFDGGHGSATPRDTPVVATRSGSDDNSPAQPMTADPALVKPVDEQFQRYFDRHFRAHLVLDAAAHRAFEVE
jgi:hypothetical protein